MPLPSPNLDDRSFDQLVDAAVTRIRQVSPEWTDLSPSDPGIVLVDVFAYLTEALIYRLNQVPDKLYIEFLRLIGVRLEPPAAASVTLHFRRTRRGPAIEIPRGTRITVDRPATGSEPPVFATAETVTLARAADEVEVLAYHAEQMEAEQAGLATGKPGMAIQVRRPPIIAPTGHPLDLLVAVEALPEELAQGDPAIEHDGKVYRIWREVQDFSDPGDDGFVYLADRLSGTIVFAPEARMTAAEGQLAERPVALAAVPQAGRDIRVWYRRGGGAAGNVAAGVLTTPKDPLPDGLEVTNPGPATGGRDAETLENALVRGPQELHTLSRAVTARDFQLVAKNASGAVSRAMAVTQAELWRYASPGTVEVFLVPSLPQGASEATLTAEQLEAAQTPDAVARVRAELDRRRTLATTCLVDWARYKTVRVRAEIHVHREEDRDEVRRRVDERIHLTVNPLPTELNAGGWPFGQSLFASTVYKIILAEPGVRYARGIQLLVDEVPDRDVKALAADPYQPSTWYSGSGAKLFRSLNDGQGWEAMAGFENEAIVRVRPHPERPGLVSLATRIAERRSRIYVSRDSGATWERGDPMAFTVSDLAWIDEEEGPVILLATDVGLYRISASGELAQIVVDPTEQDLGFWSVAATRDVRGGLSVAVAAREVKGVFLSSRAGQSGSFEAIGPQGKDVRVLSVQELGPNRFLWAGVSAVGDTGEGCLSWQLLGDEKPVELWRTWKSGWR
jgi:hypothetical protein